MPELPEVETIVRELADQLPGRRIADLVLLNPVQVSRPDPEMFRSRLLGREIQRVGRVGKWVEIQLEGPIYWLIHLRMTGCLLLTNGSPPRSPHTRAWFRLGEDFGFQLHDVRTFGRLELLSPAERQARHGQLGLDPLDPEFSTTALGGALSGTRMPIATALLDQGRIAGLGNIYVNEALFAAGLHPRRAVPSLARSELEALREAIVSILTEAIHYRGSSISDYRTPTGSRGRYQERFRVYRRLGLACPACETPVQRVFLAGRSSFFCPRCQG